MRALLISASFLLLGAWGGAALHKHRDTQAAEKQGHMALAMLALNQCNRFLGAIIVTKDGHIQPFADMPLAAAQDLATKIPTEVVNTPCGPPTSDM